MISVTLIYFWVKADTAHQNYSQQISDKGQLTTHPSQSSTANIFWISKQKNQTRENPHHFVRCETSSPGRFSLALEVGCVALPKQRRRKGNSPIHYTIIYFNLV